MHQNIPVYTALSHEMALVLTVVLFCMTFVKQKPRSSKAFGWAVLSALLACVCDGLAYLRFSPEIPSSLIHIIMSFDMMAGDITLLFFTAYCYFYISERTTLDKRLFYIPMSVICVCIVYTFLYILQGKIYSIHNNRVTILGAKPLLASLVDFAFIVYTPVVAFMKRKQIGIKAVLLLGAFGILPFVTYMVALIKGGVDYSFIASAFSLVICFLLLQNSQNEETERKQRMLIQSAYERVAKLNVTLQEQNDVIAGARMGVWSIELKDGKEPVMHANATMEELLGIRGQSLDPEETYKAWFNNIEESALDSVNASVNAMIKHGADENTYKWIHPELGERYVRCGGFSRQIPDGHLLSGYHYDVTEQVGKEARLSFIISSLAYSYDYLAYISLDDLSFNVIDDKIPHDQAFASVASGGGNAMDAINYTCEHKISPEFKKQMVRFTDLSTLNQRLKHSQAVVNQYKNEKDIWFMWSFIAADRNPDGTLKHVICAVRKIDEEKQIQLRQQQIIDENIAANKAKTQFLQNMSHEIRTPLNAMFGFSQLLGLPDGTWSEEEKDSYNVHILNSYNMLEMLISDILDIADSEHGNYQILISDTDVNEVCKNAMVTAEYRKQAAVNMYFTTELPDGYTIKSDGRRIQQVLINYLTNACKHTDSGEIHLHCSSSEHPGRITFSVADTGCGIQPAQADTIFNRFTKLNKFDQGSGLGLNICQLIADKLGGKVYLDKNYTGGARFIFEIDARSEA